MKKNIVLIGMMGCGKTTTGDELSRELSDYKYIDIDAEIEKSTQKKISEMKKFNIFVMAKRLLFLPVAELLKTRKIEKLCLKLLT